MILGLDPGTWDVRIVVAGVDAVPRGPGDPADPADADSGRPASGVRAGAGVDADVGGWSGAAPVVDILAGIRLPSGRTLAEAADEVTAVAAAVPDAWAERGTAGALARERLRRELVDDLRLPLVAFPGRTAALAAAFVGQADPDAWVPVPGRGVLMLVCDVGADAVSVALCACAQEPDAGGTGVKPLRVTTVPTGLAESTGARAGLAGSADAAGRFGTPEGRVSSVLPEQQPGHTHGLARHVPPAPAGHQARSTTAAIAHPSASASRVPTESAGPVGRSGPAGAGSDGFERRLLAVAGLDPGAPGTLAGLRAAMRTQRPRAALALPRARTLSRYRDTPAYRWDAATGTATVTAGAVLDCFEPVAAAVRTAVTRTLHSPDGATGMAGDPEQFDVVIAGSLGRSPAAESILFPVLSEAVGRGGSMPVVLGEGAAARGAALIAAGRVRVDEPHADTVALPIHRIRAGRLRLGRIVLARAGAPRGVGDPAAVDGDAVVVEVTGDGGRPLDVEIGEGWAPLPPAGTVPPGRYTAAYWPNRGDAGVVALRPVGSGELCLYLLAAASELDTGERTTT